MNLNPARNALFLLIAAALGCGGDSSSGSPELECGEGARTVIGSTDYCVYEGALIIEGFACPEGLSRVPLDEGAAVAVCGEGTPTPEQIEEVRARFAPQPECVVGGAPGAGGCAPGGQCAPESGSCTADGCAGSCVPLVADSCVVGAPDSPCAAGAVCEPLGVSCASAGCAGTCGATVAPLCFVNEATSSCSGGEVCLRNPVNSACDPSTDASCGGVCGPDPCAAPDACPDPAEPTCELRDGAAFCSPPAEPECVVGGSPACQSAPSQPQECVALDPSCDPSAQTCAGECAILIEEPDCNTNTGPDGQGCPAGQACMLLEPACDPTAQICQGRCM